MRTLKPALLLSFIFLGSTLFQLKADGGWHPPVNEGFYIRPGLSLVVNNSLFFINNEFFGDIVEGYTLPGYLASPVLVYTIGNRFNFSAGATLLKFHGDSSPLSAYPLLSARLRLTDSLDLVIGSLRGGGQHLLHDQLFHSENEILKPVRNGLQLIYDGSKFYIDTWIDWQQYIRDGDTIPEEFTAAISARFAPIAASTGYSLVFPLQVVAWHSGGQIGTRATPVQSLVNLASGLEATKILQSRLKEVGVFGHLMLYRDLTGASNNMIDEGHGFYTGVKARTDQSSLAVGWWNARDFLAPRGNPIFGSVAASGEGHEVFSDREMLVGSYRWSKTFFPNLQSSFLFAGYLDTRASWFDYSMGVMLRFVPSFFMVRHHQVTAPLYTSN